MDFSVFDLFYFADVARSYLVDHPQLKPSEISRLCMRIIPIPHQGQAAYKFFLLPE